MFDSIDMKNEKHIYALGFFDGVHLGHQALLNACRDLAQHLGCGGCMAQLRRVQAGEYTIEESVPLQILLETENPEQYLRPVDSMFRNYPKVILSPKQEKCCRNGAAFSIQLDAGTYRCYSKDGEFLSLSKVEDGILSTIKSFFDV